MNSGYTDYYDANLELLKKHHFTTWEYITQNQPEPLGEISHAPNGNPNLIVTDSHGNLVTLHNETNPEKEALDFLERVPEDHKGFVAILGMGLCYSIFRILKERPQLQRLAIFELEPGIFVQTLRHMDLSPILKDSRLILSIGTNIMLPEVLAAAARTLQLENASVFHHQPSFNFNLEGYNQLKDDLFAHLNDLNVGGATTRVLGGTFLNNRFKHITTIHHHLLLEQLKNKFNGVPAILVAGGPSLDKNIHLLKQVQDKAVIIAVDTVLPTLLKNEVHPHFLTCIDSNDLTFEKFADIISSVKDTALICSSWVNPKTPKTFPADQVFWTFTSGPMERWFNSLLGGDLFTGGASTVAHLNLIAAYILGCEPIIFMGQDLAYPGPDSSSHAKGTVLQGSAPSDILSTHVEGETVTGMNGEILRTNRSFLMMKKFFESAIAASDKPHINATEGGANIEGTQILTLQETMDTHCNTQINVSNQIKAFCSNSEPIDPTKMLSEFNKKLCKIKQLLKTIDKADTITKPLLKEILKLKKNKRIIKSFNMLSQAQQKQINKIDKSHGSLDNELEIWQLLEEITMTGLKESERQKQEISTLQNDPNRYTDWLIKNLYRLTDINKIRKETLTCLLDNMNMTLSFHQEENKYLEQINKGSHKEQNLLKLARLYMRSKNYTLASPLLEDLYNTLPESGEVHFYLGCIATQFSNFKKAEQYFKAAKGFDPELIQQIDSFIQEFGDTFLGFAQYFKTQPGRELSVKYMVQKGLRFHPTHMELKKELEIILKEELKTIKSDVDNGDYEKSGQLLSQWHQIAKDQKHVFDSIPPELVSNIFLYQAKLFLSQKAYPDAIENLNAAMKYTPDNPDIHSALIDTLFITGDFNTAIPALNKAIEIDNQFALYWETIGDSLEDSGQHENAILAYENCFTRLPGNIKLLKKIGDCYMEMNQLEAAKAAYEQLKIRLETPGS